MHDVWHSRMSTLKHSNTPCLCHTDVVFIGQLKLVNNLFSNLALLQLLTLGVLRRRVMVVVLCVCVCVCVWVCVCLSATLIWGLGLVEV